MLFQSFITAAVLASGTAFAAPASVASRQTYIGSVEFTTVDGTTVHSNMQIGAGYRQLSTAFLHVSKRRGNEYMLIYYSAQHNRESRKS